MIFFHQFVQKYILFFTTFKNSKHKAVNIDKIDS